MSPRVVAGSVGVLLIAAGSIARPAYPQVASPLPIDVALEQPEFPTYAPIALSPDGRLVAYTLHHPERRQRPIQGYTATGVSYTAVGSRVWLTEVQTGRTHPVTGDNATSWLPVWSPDGRWLAFYSDADGLARLWVWDASTGEARVASEALVRAHTLLQGPRWTPDSRRVVAPILPYGSGLPEAQPSPVRGEADAESRQHPTAPTVTVLRTDPKYPYGGQQTTPYGTTDSRGRQFADLALIDVTNGSVTTLARNYWIEHYSVSSDGRFVAFTSEQPAALDPASGRYTSPYDLLVVAIDGAGPAPAATIAAGVSIPDFSRSLAWSPDGRTLLYSVTAGTGREQYFVATPNEWRPRRIGAAGAAAIGAEVRNSVGRTLWWDQSAEQVYVLEPRQVAVISMPDGLVRATIAVPTGYEAVTLVGRHGRGATHRDERGSLLVVVSHDSTRRMGFARLDPTGRTWRIVREDDRFYGGRHFLPVDVADDGRIAFTSESATDPRDIWIADPELLDARQITRTAPRMAEFVLGATRLIEWTTATGVVRRGTLLLPAGYRAGRRYPLVVYPYPADKRSELLNAFGVTGTGIGNMQLLATRGIAVLAPDVWPIDQTDQMRELAAVILPGVERVIELGIADSTRIGVTGHSWGGYTVLALLVQTQRFRAAIMRGGHGDAVAELGTLRPSGWAHGVLLQELHYGGTLWEQSERYLANSPIQFLDRVRTPLLIIHGESETTVPIFLANQIFAGLQRLGREAEFARYAGENHGEKNWAYVNQRDHIERSIRWWETHLIRE